MFKFIRSSGMYSGSAAALLAAFGTVYAAPPSGLSTSVTVINGSTNPVPVAGTVGISGVPTVRLQDNTVLVENHDTAPVFVRVLDAGPLEPVQANVTVTATCPNSACSINPALASLYEVPTGTRLVIEFVSAMTTSPTSTARQMFIETVSGGVTATHQLLIHEQDGWRRAAQTLRLYADGDTKVKAGFATGSEQASATFSFSGYLVNAP